MFRALPLAPLVLLAAACSYPTDAQMYETTGGPVPDGGGFSLVASVPAAGATNITLGAAVVLTFSDFPDPTTVLSSLASITIASARNNYDYTSSVDLIPKSVTLQKASPFTASTQYDISITSNVKSLAGAQATATTFSFTTGSTPGGGPMPPTKRTLATDVQPIFNNFCVLPGCHDATASGALDLTSGRSTANLLNVASSEVPTLARVNASKSDPATSYLMRKLLYTPDIVLSGMPLGSHLPEATLRIISDWIATGASP
jgi:hypothetical protein